MTFKVAERVQKYRSGLRAAGLRPVQIWVPDTRREGFESLCAKQAQLVANLELDDRDLARDLNLAVRDIDGWQ